MEAVPSRPFLKTALEGPPPAVVLAVGRPEDPDLERARAQGAAILEARIDLLPSPDGPSAAKALALLRRHGLPLLLTCRAASEGGRYSKSEAEREALLVGALDACDAVDVELASPIAPRIAREARSRGKAVLASHHRFDATPDDRELEARFAQGKALGADLVKIACAAASAGDVLRLLSLAHRHRDEGVVCISMGPLGAVSRAAAGRFGSRLTYAGQDLDYGQIPLDRLTAALDALYPERRA